jgi:quinol monooxygenase YgiN
MKIENSVGLLAVLLLICTNLTAWWELGNCKSTLESREKEGVFVLAVTMRFKTTSDYEKFVAIWTPVADHCRNYEPGTLSYEMMQSDKDPNQIMILERYATKDDYLEVHKKSAPFLTFRPQLAALEPEIAGQSYIESNVGYI